MREKHNAKILDIPRRLYRLLLPRPGPSLPLTHPAAARPAGRVVAELGVAEAGLEDGVGDAGELLVPVGAAAEGQHHVLDWKGGMQSSLAAGPHRHHQRVHLVTGRPSASPTGLLNLRAQQIQL